MAQARGPATPGRRQPAAATSRAASSAVQTRAGPRSATFGEIPSAANGPASTGPVSARQRSPSGGAQSGARDRSSGAPAERGDSVRPDRLHVVFSWCKTTAQQCKESAAKIPELWTKYPEAAYDGVDASYGHKFMNVLTRGVKSFIWYKIVLFVLLVAVHMGHKRAVMPSGLLRAIYGFVTTWLFYDLNLLFYIEIRQHIMPCVFKTDKDTVGDWKKRPELSLLILYIRIAFVFLFCGVLFEVYNQKTELLWLSLQYVVYLIVYYVIADNVWHGISVVMCLVYCLIIWHQHNDFIVVICSVPCMPLMVNIIDGLCFDNLSLQNHAKHMLNKRNEVVTDDDAKEHKLDSASLVKKLSAEDRVEMRLFVICVAFCSMVRTAFWMQKLDIYVDSHPIVSCFMLSQCVASLFQLCWCADVNVGLNAFLTPCAGSRSGCMRVVAEIVYFICSTPLKSMLGLESEDDANIVKAASSEHVKIGCVCIVIFVQAIQVSQIVCAHSYCTVDSNDMLSGMKCANLLQLKAAMQKCLDGWHGFSFCVSLGVSCMMFVALRGDRLIVLIIGVTVFASKLYSIRSQETFKWCNGDNSTWYHLYIRNLTVDGVFIAENYRAFLNMLNPIWRNAADYARYALGSYGLMTLAWCFDFYKLKEEWTNYAACFILLVPLACILLFKLSSAKDNENQWAIGVEQGDETRLQPINRLFINEMRAMMQAYKVATTANTAAEGVVPSNRKRDLSDIAKGIQAGKSKAAHVTAQFLKPARIVVVTVDGRPVRLAAWKDTVQPRWSDEEKWTYPQQMLMAVLAIIHGGVKSDTKDFNKDKLHETLLKARQQGMIKYTDADGNEQVDNDLVDRYTEAINSLCELCEVKDGQRLCCRVSKCKCMDNLAQSEHFRNLWEDLAEHPSQAAIDRLLQLFVLPSDGSNLPPLPAARFFHEALVFVGLPPRQ